VTTPLCAPALTAANAFIHRVNCAPPQPRNRLRVSRTRLIMGLLLIVAIAIFVSLANKAVQENGEALRQMFGR
jgi:hypothetical protein